MNTARRTIREWIAETIEVFGDVTVMDSIPFAAVRTTRISAGKEVKPLVKKARRKSKQENQESLI